MGAFIVGINCRRGPDSNTVRNCTLRDQCPIGLDLLIEIMNEVMTLRHFPVMRYG